MDGTLSRVLDLEFMTLGYHELDIRILKLRGRGWSLLSLSLSLSLFLSPPLPHLQ